MEKILKYKRTNEQTNGRSNERIEQKFMNEILSKTRERLLVFPAQQSAVLTIFTKYWDLLLTICVITSDFKYKWFGTFQRKTMKKNVLVRSRTFWIVLERSFEIRVYVCKQEFRLFLIVQNLPERSLSFQNVLLH